MENKDADVKKIILEYEDGSKKEIAKGVVLTVLELEEENQITMEFANVTGADLNSIAYGFIGCMAKMGVLDDQNEDEDALNY